MNSNIALYSKCKITPEKNFKVDDIEDYLTSIEGAYFYTHKVQYFKHALKVTCRVNFDQSFLYIGNSTTNFNYAKVYEGTIAQTNIHYYFIVNKRWISETCLELELEMDTLNTLKTLVSLSSKTMILREHKNRWKNAGEPGLYLPKIDLYSEGINAILFKTKETPLYEYFDDDFVLGSFYLIYRSADADEQGNAIGAVNVFCCGDDRIEVNVSASGGYSGTITWNDLDAGYGDTFIIYGGDITSNVGAKVTFTLWKTKKESQEVTFEIENSSQAIICSRKHIYHGYVDNNGFHTISEAYYRAITGKQFDNFEVEKVHVARQVGSSVLLSDLTPTYIREEHPMSLIEQWTTINSYLEAITSIDRTDPKLVKIVKLPYRPLTFNLNSNGVLVSIPDGWVFEQNISGFPSMLKLKDGNNLTKCLKRNLFLATDDDNYESPYDVLEYETQDDRGKLVARNDNYETKLKNSDYLLQKMVYDSFSFEFKAELMETDGGPTMLNVNFDVTLTLSSKFMFEFPLTTFNSGLKMDNQDYSGIMYVARNNEVPLFNSAYLNYVRTGYNYDIKTRNRQLASSIVGGTLATIGAIGSFVSSIYTGGIGITAGIGLATTATKSFYNAISRTAQNDQNIAEKLHTTQMQGISVAGADDVDLMSEYTDDNKAKLVMYEVTPKMKKALCDLFYYCGYIAGYQGIPNETSRKVFNFVQADILFNVMQYNVSNDLLDDYKKKYSDGVTIIHHYTLKDANNQNVRGWDFEQQYENWETTLS